MLNRISWDFTPAVNDQTGSIETRDSLVWETRFQTTVPISEFLARMGQPSVYCAIVATRETTLFIASIIYPEQGTSLHIVKQRLLPGSDTIEQIQEWTSVDEVTLFNPDNYEEAVAKFCPAVTGTASGRARLHEWTGFGPLKYETD